MKQYACECDRCIFHKDTGYGKESFEYCDLARKINDVKLSKIPVMFEETISYSHCPFFKEDYDYEEILKKALEEVSRAQIEEILKVNCKTPIKDENKVNANHEFLKNTLAELQKTVYDATKKFSSLTVRETLEELVKSYQNEFYKTLTELKHDELRIENCEKLAKDIRELVDKEDLKDDRL